MLEGLRSEGACGGLREEHFRQQCAFSTLQKFSIREVIQITGSEMGASF